MQEMGQNLSSRPPAAIEGVEEDESEAGEAGRPSTQETAELATPSSDGPADVNSDTSSAESGSLWPLQKLLARARHEASSRIVRDSNESVSESSSTVKPAPTAVLLMTGALNPVHNGHLASLEFARQACEAQGVVVLAGFLSPSHDSYVGPKMARKVRCLPVHSPIYTHTRTRRV